MNGVGARKAAAFEANAAQIGICLNNVLNGFGADVVLNGELGFQAVGNQGVIAQLR